MKINKGERIVTTWPEYCRGPGWSNSIVWIIVEDRAGKTRTECLQPNEQSIGIKNLFEIAAIVHQQFMHEVSINKAR